MAKSNQSPFLKKATGTAKSSVAAEPKKRHGLGRGLDSLLPTDATAAVAAPAFAKVPAVVASPVAAPSPVAAAPQPGAPLELRILEIERSPFQPRRDFKETELMELADSLKNNGLVQPPTVRRNAAGRYELIAGERRLRAAQLAGWTKIRVTLIEADDQTAAVMTTTENLQREDLNPIEEAVSYKNLQDRFNLTQQEVADKVGKGRATVANSVRLLELPEEVKTLLQTKLLSVGHAKVLLSVDGEKERILLARDCVNDQLTVRALEKKVARMNSPVVEKQRGTPDIPDGYLRSLVDKLKKHLGCAVRLTSGVTHANGRHTKGVLEIDFYDNDDLDRVIAMLGLAVD
ncbi:MAG: ParB/RepB/Spo0J family partition protein [Kiritimatiellae bacterium]|nr:ParB/RepB/Spo0J family partition protein [Kiritimatiellia bacterium]